MGILASPARPALVREPSRTSAVAPTLPSPRGGGGLGGGARGLGSNRFAPVRQESLPLQQDRGVHTPRSPPPTRTISSTTRATTTISTETATAPSRLYVLNSRNTVVGSTSVYPRVVPEKTSTGPNS